MVDTTTLLASFISGLPAMVGSFATLAGIVYTTYKLHQGQEEAAAKAVVVAAEVKDTLLVEASKVREAVLAQNEKSDHKLDVVHAYVNNSLGASLRLTATSLRRVASLTKDSEDVGLAEAATKAADAHDAAQAKIVAKLKP